MCGCSDSDGGKFQVRTAMLWSSCLYWWTCSLLVRPSSTSLHNVGLQPLPAECTSQRCKHPVLQKEQEGLLFSEECQHKWNTERENPALSVCEKEPLPSSLLSSGKLQVLPLCWSKTVKETLNSGTNFSLTFPRQQLLSPVKPPRLLIKLWAARILMPECHRLATG